MFFGHGNHQWMSGPFTFQGPLGIFFTLLFWGLLAYFIYLGIGLLRNAGRRENDTAVQILRQRFARGEIDQDQFNEMRQQL